MHDAFQLFRCYISFLENMNTHIALYVMHWLCHADLRNIKRYFKIFNLLSFLNIEMAYRGYPAKGPYPPCLHMADRALLAGYPWYTQIV